MRRCLPAIVADVPSWLEIVREVEPLFGPMPEFETTLVRKISEGGAFCVRREERCNSQVLGGVLLGGTHEHGWIRWLAVLGSARGQGIGVCLLETALHRFSQARTASVLTFREDIIAGRPARRLYERMGFVPGALVFVDGHPRQEYSKAIYGRAVS
jgi:ribosomal protein S18 acetylase RimI-like enzyme